MNNRVGWNARTPGHGEMLAMRWDDLNTPKAQASPSATRWMASARYR